MLDMKTTSFVGGAWKSERDANNSVPYRSKLSVSIAHYVLIGSMSMAGLHLRSHMTEGSASSLPYMVA